MSFVSQASQVLAWGAGSVQAFTATSTAAVDTGSLHGEVLFYATTQCHIRFGTSSVGAATANDFPIPAGQIIRLRCDHRATHFRVIRSSADGNLHYVVVGT